MPGHIRWKQSTLQNIPYFVKMNFSSRKPHLKWLGWLQKAKSCVLNIQKLEHPDRYNDNSKLDSRGTKPKTI